MFIFGVSVWARRGIYCYQIWMGGVRGGKMKKYKEAKEETYIY